MSYLDPILKLFESIGKYGAMVLMLACMCIVTCDVVFRYLLAMPLGWSNDVLTLYVLPGIFYLGLPASYSALAHVQVDLIYAVTSRRATLWVSTISRLAAIIVFAAIAYYAWHRFAEAWMRAEVVPGPRFDWPVWPSLVIVPFASVVIALRACERLIAEITAAAQRDDVARQDAALARATPRGEAI